MVGMVAKQVQERGQLENDVGMVQGSIGEKKAQKRKIRHYLWPNSLELVPGK